MSVTLKELLAHIVCYSPAPPYSELFYTAFKPEKLAAGWGTSDFTVRFAMFGVPTLAGEWKRPFRTKARNRLTIKDATNFETGPQEVCCCSRQDGRRSPCMRTVRGIFK